MKNIFQGKAFEHLFISECISRGVVVSQPQVDVGYDFLVEADRKYKRVQVKSCVLIREKADGTISYQVSLSRYGGSKKEAYSDRVCDVVSIYLPHIGFWYLIPVSEVKKKTIYLNIDDENCTFASYKDNWEILTQ
jgi:hypothetical protein